MLIFNFNKEVHPIPGKEEGDEIEVCTNYRYALRHDPALSSNQRTTQKKEEEKTEAVDKATPRAVVKATKPPKATAQKKDKTKGAEEKIGETAKKSDSRLAKPTVDPRENYRPKVFTKEEKDAWKAYAKNITDFYGELIMKQINQNESEENPVASGKRIM